MEIFKTASIIIAIVLGVCFVLFLLWITAMVFILKYIPNDKIKAMSYFFHHLPIKRFFSFFSNNNIHKNEK
jgi:hypothetical protein